MTADLRAALTERLGAEGAQAALDTVLTWAQVAAAVEDEHTLACLPEQEHEHNENAQAYRHLAARLGREYGARLLTGSPA